MALVLAVEPSEGAFDYPAAGQHGKAVDDELADVNGFLPARFQVLDKGAAITGIGVPDFYARQPGHRLVGPRYSLLWRRPRAPHAHAPPRSALGCLRRFGDYGL